MAEDEAVLLFGAPHLRNGDAEFRFRQDSDLYWLSGWEQPQAALFMARGPLHLVRSTQRQSHGNLDGLSTGSGAVMDYGADVAYEIGDLPQASRVIEWGV